MSNPPAPVQRKWRTIGLEFVVLAVVLLMPLLHDGSLVELLGVDLPAWLVALAFYALCVGAGAAAVRSRSG